MTVSRTTLAVLIVGLIGLGLAYGLLQRKTPDVAEKTAVAGAPSNPPRAIQSHAGAAEPDAVARTNTAPAVSDYAKSFRDASNYRDFIMSALSAAQSGDRDAQYYVSAAISYCDETNRFFFRRRDKTLTVDEAIAERAALPGIDMTAAIRRANRRCQDVNSARDPAWGTADQWLAKATQAGQPLAQARTAENIFLHITKTGAAEAPKPGSAGETGTLRDARSLALAAVQSKNVEAIFEMGDLLPILKPGLSQSDFEHEALTWRYVACLRGLDCGVNAEWHLQMCLADPSCLPDESGIDYLRRSAQVSMIDLEQKARALNDKIDAQAWNEMGLGS